MARGFNFDNRSGLRSTSTALATYALLALAVPFAEAREMKEIGPAREVVVELQPDATLEAKLPPGEITIERASGATLRGFLTVRCPADSQRCAEDLVDTDFSVSRAGKKSTLRLNKRLRDLHYPVELIMRIEVPPVRRIEISSAAGEVDIRGVEATSLNVNLKAGELHIVDVTACPSVEMLAGEVIVSMPEARVAAVRLDAGVGDVELVRGHDRLEGRRSWLIGAELEWDEGNGDCDIDVDVQTGEARVELTD